MRKVREVLRLLWGQGRSVREVAVSCRLARSTVGDYQDRASRAGLSWPLPDVSDEVLEGLLFPPPPGVPAGERPLPDWAEINKKLTRKGETRRRLWLAYREEFPDGFAYSKFCEALRAWLGGQGLSMRQVHIAGERVYVDYAGPTLEIVDASTGEIGEAQVFVAALGASQCTFAEATWTQGLPDWIGSHVRMLAYFDGVPEIVTPDNTKTGVTHPHLYEPDVNRAYLEFAEHYGLAVIPARSRSPKDYPEDSVIPSCCHLARPDAVSAGNSSG